MKRSAWWLAVSVGMAGGVLLIAWHGRTERERWRAAIETETKRAEEARAASGVDEARRGMTVADDGEAIAHLRGELEALKRSVAERARAREAAGVERRPGPAVERERSMAAEMVPAAEWRNRGRASPTDAMETALWAAAGGDVTALAEMLELAPAARAKAEALLQRLPETIRAQTATPEQLVALLGSTDVPLGSAMILTPDTKDAPGTWRVAQISDGKGKLKRAAIALTEKAGRWSLVVPESAIDRYAARLGGSDAVDLSAMDVVPE